MQREAYVNPNNEPLHCLRKVRCQEEISQETVARRLGVDVDTVKKLEQESTDIPLSLLYEWKELLNVPIRELLLEEKEQGLVPTLQNTHAQLAAMMEIAIRISKHSKHAAVTNMVQNLINQLLEIMPELREVMMQNRPERPSLLDELPPRGRV